MSSAVQANPLPISLDPPEIERWKLAILPLLLVGLRALMAGMMELSGDEAYYWAWSRNLAGGYFDHPPMVAWLIRLSVGAIGTTELGVRMPGILLAAGSMLVAGDIARICGASGRTVLRLQVALFCLPIIQVQAAIMTPDGPALFFTLAAVAWGLRYLIDPRSPRHWLMLGTTCGLAMLSKYTALLPVGAILVFMLLARPKHALRTVMAGAVAVLVLWPVLIWNHQHDWISFRFQLGHGMGEDGRPWWSTLLDYGGGQLLAATPVLACLMVWAGVGTLRRGTDPRTRLLAVVGGTILVFFAFTALRHKVEVNWPTMAWPILLILLVLHVQRLDGRLWAALRTGVIVAAVFTVVVNMPPALLARLNAHAPTGTLGGWKPLARRIQKPIGDLRVYATRYQDAALLAFYMHGRPRIPVLRSPQDRMSQFDLPPHPQLPEGEFVIVSDAKMPLGPVTLASGPHTYGVQIMNVERVWVDLDGIQRRGRFVMRARSGEGDAGPQGR